MLLIVSIAAAMVISGCAQAGMASVNEETALNENPASGSDELILLSETVSKSESASTETGILEIHLYQTTINENGQITYVPLAYAGVFLGDNSPYGGPPADGYTDVDGICTLEVTPGIHKASFKKMTSSHSVWIKSFGHNISITAGKKTELYVGYAIYETTVIAEGDAGWGNAYYITGQSDDLGNWHKAFKMDYVNGKWSYHGYAPRNAEFKIIKAAWTDADHIIIENSSVQWEQGYNHKIEFAGLYLPPNIVYPVFEN